MAMTMNSGSIRWVVPATVTCRSKRCVCLMMRHRAFDALLGSLDDVIAQNSVYYTLKAAVPALSRRSERYLRRLASLAVEVRIEPGDPVAHMYELCDRFAVVRSGRCVRHSVCARL